MVKTPCYYYRGHRFDPWSGKILHAAQPSQKRKLASVTNQGSVYSESQWLTLSIIPQPQCRQGTIMPPGGFPAPPGAQFLLPEVSIRHGNSRPLVHPTCASYTPTLAGPVYIHPSCLLLPAPGSLPFLASISAPGSFPDTQAFPLCPPEGRCHYGPAPPAWME